MASSSDGAPGAVADMGIQGHSPPVPGSGQRPGGAGGPREPLGMRGAGSAGCNAELEAPKLHFVHSSVLGGHFSNLFPVGPPKCSFGT